MSDALAAITCDPKAMSRLGVQAGNGSDAPGALQQWQAARLETTQPEEASDAIAAPAETATTAFPPPGSESIRIDSAQTQMVSIGFATPPGRSLVDATSRRVVFQDGPITTTASHQTLSREEAWTGSRRLLEETLPINLLEAIRQQDASSQILDLGSVVSRGSLKMGWAEVRYSNKYARHLWVVHISGMNLYTFVTEGSLDERERIAEQNRVVGGSVTLLDRQDEVGDRDTGPEHSLNPGLIPAIAQSTASRHPSHW